MLISQLKKKNSKTNNRTIGISKIKYRFFNNNILNIEKIIINIKKIEIFTVKIWKMKN